MKRNVIISIAVLTVAIAVVGVIGQRGVSAQESGPPLNPAANGVCTFVDSSDFSEFAAAEVASYGDFQLALPGQYDGATTDLWSVNIDGGDLYGQVQPQNWDGSTGMELDENGEYAYVVNQDPETGDWRINKIDVAAGDWVGTIELPEGIWGAIDVNNGRIAVSCMGCGDLGSGFSVYSTDTGALYSSGPGTLLYTGSVVGHDGFVGSNGVAIDSEGSVYISTWAFAGGDGLVHKFVNGNEVISWDVNDPADIEVDAEDNVYVASRGDGKVYKYDGNGTYLGEFGTISCGWCNLPPLLVVDDGINLSLSGDGTTATATIIGTDIDEGSSPAFDPNNFQQTCPEITSWSLSNGETTVTGATLAELSVEVGCANGPNPILELQACSYDKCSTAEVEASVDNYYTFCKVPVPICVNGISVDLDTNGAASFTAGDIIIATPQPGPITSYYLELPFSELAVEGTTLENTVMEVSCEQAETEIVIAGACNSVGCDYCETFVAISDPLDACGPLSMSTQNRSANLLTATLSDYTDPGSTCEVIDPLSEYLGVMYQPARLAYDWATNDMYIIQGSGRDGYPYTILDEIFGPAGEWPYGKIQHWDCGDPVSDDTDGDGVIDELDHCPALAGLPERAGCPVADFLSFTLQTTGKGKPTFDPIPGVTIKVFDKDVVGNVNPDEHGTVFEADDGLVGQCVTNTDGTCVAGEEEVNDYVVIAKWFDEEQDQTVYLGKVKSTDDFFDGEAYLDLKLIKKYKKGEFDQYLPEGRVSTASSGTPWIYAALAAVLGFGFALIYTEKFCKNCRKRRGKTI